MAILISLMNACKKEPSTRDLFTAVKWQVTDFCGPVGDPYTWTFNPNGQLIQEQGYMNTIYSTWSLKDNNNVLVIGGNEYKIIVLTETELEIKGFDLFDCAYIFNAIPL
jgi:hypothetical protein